MTFWHTPLALPHPIQYGPRPSEPPEENMTFWHAPPSLPHPIPYGPRPSEPPEENMTFWRTPPARPFLILCHMGPDRQSPRKKTWLSLTHSPRLSSCNYTIKNLLFHFILRRCNMKWYIPPYEHQNFSKILIENRQRDEVYLTVRPSMFQQKFTSSLDIGFLLLMGYHCLHTYREQGFKFHQSESEGRRAVCSSSSLGTERGV
jgi:hypothetical protein